MSKGRFFQLRSAIVCEEEEKEGVENERERIHRNITHGQRHRYRDARYKIQMAMDRKRKYLGKMQT